MSITAERRKAVDFTDRYYRLPSRMLAAPGTDTAVGSFRGKRIGTLLGVQGTPATLIGNQLVPGAIPYDELEQLVKAELAKRS